MPQKVENCLFEISQALFEAKEAYEMYWLLKADKRPVYVDVMRKYLNATLGLLRALRNSAVIATYNVIENPKGNQTKHTIFRLFEHLKEANWVTSEQIDILKARLKKHDAVIRGITILRNHLIGHRAENTSYDKAHKDADIKYGPWRELLEELVAIICEIYAQLSLEQKLQFSTHKAADDLEAMLSDLKALHAAKLK